MEKKYIRVTMADGSKWDIPCERIAQNRTDFYSKHSEKVTYDEDDEEVLICWLQYNLSWSQVCDVAEKVADGNVAKLFDFGITSGDKRIITKTIPDDKQMELPF